jgi:hypothetical protein
MPVRLLVPALVGLVLCGGDASRIAAQASSLPRVYVSTDPAGEKNELRDRQQSVKDLRSALASKKKTLVMSDSEERSDITVEVIERTTTVPKVRIGVAAPGGPARAVHLRVKLTRGSEDPVELTNTNTVFETSGGWTAAAEDVAKQIEKWIAAHGSD